MILYVPSSVFVLLCFVSIAACVTEKNAIKNFPLGLNCNSAIDSDDDDPDQPMENDTVQCTIRLENEILFNESIIWKNRLDNGSMDAESRFQNKVISISAAWDNHTSTLEFRMTIKEPTPLDCSFDAFDEPRAVSEGESEKMGPKLPAELEGDMSLQQFKDIETIWYHGCEKIERDNPDYGYVPGYYTRPNPWVRFKRMFEKLSIKNVTFERAGVYHVVLKYKGFITFVESRQICVKAESDSNQLVIRANSRSFSVQSGDDLVVSCFGNVDNNGDNVVTWAKFNESTNKFDDICDTRNDDDDASTNMCNYKPPPKFCYKVTADKIAEARKNSVSFVSNLTLRNLALTDSGKYQCKVSSTGTYPEFQFSVLVRDKVTAHNDLTIVLSILAGIMFLLLILLLIYRWKRVECQYVYLRTFAKVKKSEKMVTCLIYADDAFDDQNSSNPVRDTVDWLNAENHNYHDPNEGKNPEVGEHFADHTLDVLDNCHSVTIVLTPKLFTDDNDVTEIFKTFRGFEKNVQRSFPILFICTKSMEKEIYKNAKPKYKNDEDSEEKYADQEIFVTFSRFMKRNKVIHWKATDKTRFNRALYVAMPKVKKVKTPEVFSNSMVNNNANEIPMV